MKKRKLLATLTSAALLTAAFSAMPACVSAAETYTAATGLNTSLDKYLVMGEGANVPNVTFGYQVTAGTVQTFNANNATIAVYAGPTPEKIVFTGTGISDPTAADGQVITGSTTHTGGVSTSDYKSQGFTNEYSSHDLTFSKSVNGNQASKDKYFAFTVNLSNAVAGTRYTVSYADDNNANTADGNADRSIAASPNSATTVITTAVTQPETITIPAGSTEVSQIFYLQHGQNIVIRGLADGTKYTITDGKEDYTAVYTATDTGDTTAAKADVATNSTGIHADVTVGFTNTRSGVLPTGVILAVAAPVTIGIAVLAAIIFLMIKNRKREAEEE